MRGIKTCFAALCVAVFALAAGPAGADYEKGLALQAAGDYDGALNEWMVTSDDPRSMTAIGSLYDYGEGLPKDEAKAAEWYTKAAGRGDYRAIAQLANFSLTGAGGVEQNPAEWRGRLEAIRGKDGYADYILATFYLEGHGGEKNLEDAYSILSLLVNERSYGQLADELARSEALLADQRAGVLESEAIVNAFKADRAAFDARYKDRRMTVKGTLSSLAKLGDRGVLLRVGGIAAVFYGDVSLAPGSQVRFSGVYAGNHPFQFGDCDIAMFGCVLAEALSLASLTASEDQHP